MLSLDTFNIVLFAWIGLAAVTFVALFFVAAPYGRHTRAGWGPKLSSKVGWLVMEAPAALLFALFFALGSYRSTVTMFVFLGLWEAHYIHRAFIYPLTLRSDKRMTVLVVGLAVFFNGANAFFNGMYLFGLSGGYPAAWLLDPRFIAGTIIFIAGYAINRDADRRLRQLRKPGEQDYKIPHGGMFRWVSSPNYLGEIVEWIGWAVLTWSLAGLAFAAWTAANLVPRARAHHRWYRQHFDDYPRDRKALIPGIW